ncbi:MAG: HD domain-containing protein [Nitrososphaerota archaeon]
MNKKEKVPKEWKKYIKMISNKNLRRRIIKTIISLINNPLLELNLYESPAAKYYHHSYPKGLIQHVISTTEIGLALSKIFKKIYGIKVSKDLVLCGTLLHDLFKPLTYFIKENGSYASSKIGQLLDHQFLIVSEMLSKGFSIEETHIVAASHGEYGLVKPKRIEALIVFLADYADSYFNGEIIKGALNILKEATGKDFKKIDFQKALKIIEAMKKGGFEEVRKTIKNLI